MEYILNYLEDKPNLQKKYLDHLDRWENAKASFAHEFKNERRRKFHWGRNHIGSTLAFIAAGYNLYNSRQTILKFCIRTTKSKNPSLIKPLWGISLALSYIGLVCFWHIPSITIEFAFHYYNGIIHGTLHYLMTPDEFRTLLEKKKMDFTSLSYNDNDF